MRDKVSFLLLLRVDPSPLPKRDRTSLAGGPDHLAPGALLGHDWLAQQRRPSLAKYARQTGAHGSKGRGLLGTCKRGRRQGGVPDDIDFAESCDGSVPSSEMRRGRTSLERRVVALVLKHGPPLCVLAHRRDVVRKLLLALDALPTGLASGLEVSPGVLHPSQVVLCQRVAEHDDRVADRPRDVPAVEDVSLQEVARVDSLNSETEERDGGDAGAPWDEIEPADPVVQREERLAGGEVSAASVSACRKHEQAVRTRSLLEGPSARVPESQ